MATGDAPAPPPSDPEDRSTTGAPDAEVPGERGRSPQPAPRDEVQPQQATRSRWRTLLLIGTAVGGLAVLIGLLVLAIWVVPEWLNRRDFATPAERATAVNAARVPVAAIFAAAVAGLGVWVSHRGVVTARHTLDQTRRRDDDTTRITQAGQYTDRYIKAIGLINDDKLNARLGGLYALEQLAKEAPLSYHATIVDVLSAYIRERAPWPPTSPLIDQDAPRPRSQRRFTTAHRGPSPTADDQPKTPALDIQTALTILGRRNLVHITPDGEHHDLEDHPLDLTMASLKGAVLAGAHLEGAALYEAHLEGANLAGAHLEGADLTRAHLEGAFLAGARLEGAALYEAHLEGANLAGTHLEGARLLAARLEGAVLSEAHLEGADLSVANLKGAHLFEARLEGAFLAGVRLDGALLFRANLEGADLAGAHLEGANLKGAALAGANLRGAALAGADLSGAALDDGALTQEQLATALFDHGPERL